MSDEKNELAAAERLRADARALWADRVLDAFDPLWGMAISGTRRYCVSFGPNGRGTPRANSPGAARLAAALAVFPSLDRNAPNWPGECP